MILWTKEERDHLAWFQHSIQNPTSLMGALIEMATL